MPVLRIVTGSYEQLLFGHIVDTATGTSDQLFAFGAHIGCIKSTAISPKQGGVIITGGQDEIMKLFSLKTMRSMGELFQHAGTITHIATFSNTHILSGDQVGKLILWRTKDWEPLTTLKGHKNAIAGIAIHPSGKLALTVSVDRQLYCWNLLRGLKATKARLPEQPFDIQFGPSGSLYVILYTHSILVYDTASTHVVARYECRKIRINAVAFVDESRLVVGLETGAVELMEIQRHASEDEEQRIVSVAELSHTLDVNRIRAVTVVSGMAGDDREYYVGAASSNGYIGVWRVPQLAQTVVTPIVEFMTQCRLTSLAMDITEGDLVPSTELDSVVSDAETEVAVFEGRDEPSFSHTGSAPLRNKRKQPLGNECSEPGGSGRPWKKKNP